MLPLNILSIQDTFDEDQLLDFLVKIFIPQCLLRSINGSLKHAYVSSNISIKTSICVIYTTSFFIQSMKAVLMYLSVYQYI